MLEQGSSVNDEMTLHKKKLFTTSFSDFYRLNWKRDDDPNAFVVKKNITYTEGLSYLYEMVPKNYQYYILIDEDVIFESLTGKDVASALRDLLLEYKPISGTVLPSKGSSHAPFYSSFDVFSRDELVKIEAIPVAWYDDSVSIYSSKYIELVFPHIIHGFDGANNYTKWICRRLYPWKQMCFTSVLQTNSWHHPHPRSSGIGACSPEYDCYLFKELMVKGITKSMNMRVYGPMPDYYPYNSIREYIKSLPPVDKSDVSITRKQLGTIMKINNKHFLRRKSLVDAEYTERLTKKRYEWKWKYVRPFHVFIFHHIFFRISAIYRRIVSR